HSAYSFTDSLVSGDPDGINTHEWTFKGAAQVTYAPGSGVLARDTGFLVVDTTWSGPEFDSELLGIHVVSDAGGHPTFAGDFCVLGPLQVAANGTFLPLGGAKQRAVLALLLLHPNEVVSTDRLIDELWGDPPPESAANMLQGYVSHLRKTLEPGRGRGEHELLVSRAPGYALQIRPDQLDAERFAQPAAEGRQRLAGAEPAAA